MRRRQDEGIDQGDHDHGLGAALNQELERERLRNAKLEKKIATLQNELFAFRANPADDIVLLKKQIASLSRKLEEERKQREDLEDQVEVFQEEIHSLRQRIQQMGDMEEQLAELEEQIAKLLEKR